WLGATCWRLIDSLVPPLLFVRDGDPVMSNSPPDTRENFSAGTVRSSSCSSDGRTRSREDMSSGSRKRVGHGVSIESVIQGILTIIGFGGNARACLQTVRLSQVAELAKSAQVV